MMSRIHLCRCHVLALLLGALILPRLGRADTAADLAFTDFPGATADQLAGGQVLQQRGGLIDFQRGLTSQALYLIQAPLPAVEEKLRDWKPSAHPELKVWMHESLPPHPTAADFGALATLPANSSVNFLLGATARFDPANPPLQVDRNEAQFIASQRTPGVDSRTLFSNVWSQILAGRVDRFLNAQLGSGSYVLGDGSTIQPLNEIKSLLRSDTRIYQRYHPLLVNTPVYASNKLAPAGLYYECFDVEGSAALGTGAIYQTLANGTPAVNPGTVPPGAPVLTADIEYFVNYGIYVSIELEQLSPVNVGGRDATLVWRADLVSTQNVAYLHGTERLASGMIMLQDVKQAVDAFRTEFR